MTFQHAPTRVVVLASGTGTLLQAIIDAAGTHYTVVGVVSDQHCQAITRAHSQGIAHTVVELGEDRQEWNCRLAAVVDKLHPDLVVSAGFMRILGREFLERFGGKVINTHPALLPSFPGAHAVRDALAHGVKVTGTTVHFVDEGVDTGPIIAQAAIAIQPEDTEETLHERIKRVERKLIVSVLQHERFAPLMSTSRKEIKRALISVYDKTGLDELAQALDAAGVEIVSTGSTAAHIANLGIEVTPVEALTGFPECLEGRVKTLHPRVHAGILADTRKQDHLEQLAELEVEPFQLVVVNLYPFAETVASGADFDACVEQIDIGGPSMVRAAAKNHPSVAVVVNPATYPEVVAALAIGGFTREQRTALAVDAFRHTASYDVAVASWMGAQTNSETFSPWIGATYELSSTLRYGENPHQAAALYVNDDRGAGLAQATQLHGKDMSYNNYTDSDAAWRAAWDHDRPCVAIIKHANPCGIAVSDDSIAAAHRAAHACDPVSAFGGVIAANRTVTVEMAQQVADIFTEVIIAPSYEDGAVELLAQKKNIRILQAPAPQRAGMEMREISGGVLVQERDLIDAPGDSTDGWSLVAGPEASPELLAELEFAWKAVRAVKSNAIVLAKDGATVGVGMGQVNRVDAAKLAVKRANTLAGERERTVGAVAASDAFFPFADGFDVLAAAGVTAVVQPGGSIRDAEVVEAANKAGVTMYLTGARHFAH